MYNRVKIYREYLERMQHVDVSISEDVIEAVKNVLDTTIEVTNNSVASALKCLKMYHYLDYVTYIKEKITNVESFPRNLPIEILVQCSQIVFKAHKIANGNRGISTAFITHKLLEIMHRDDLLKFFPLIKSVEKIKCFNDYWSRILEICETDLVKLMV
jgi:hypothetical protein